MDVTQAITNELAVIGGLLVDANMLPLIEQSGITPGDFHDARCRAVYEAALDCRDRGTTYDVVTVGAAVKTRTGEDISAWAREAMIGVPALSNIPLYCELVKKESQRRRVNALLNEAAFSTTFGDCDGEIDRIIAELNDIRAGNVTDVLTGDKLSKGFLTYYGRVKSNPGEAYCKTGFDELDWQLGGGMFKSEVYIIGARPGMGKTTLGINIAENVARNDNPVLFVSLEMTDNQIMAKRIALEGGLQYTQIMTGALDGGAENIMQDTIERIADRPLYLTTKSGLTVGEISRIARQIQNIKLVIVDYLGLIAVPAESASKPRYEQMTEISAGMKALAKSLNVPVLALAQLNRENMNRKDKRPTMSDLRDSGAVEQDAGAIILLHRPEYYETREQGEAAIVEDIELNVAKNRHHAPGVVHMNWDGGKGSIKSKCEHVAAAQVHSAPATVDGWEDLPF